MTAGGVIVLHGTSSAGKTTLAHALVEQFADTGECWIVIGIDDYLGRLPPAWHRIGDHVGAHADDGFEFDLDAPGGVRVGAIGEQLLAARGRRSWRVTAASTGTDSVVRCPRTGPVSSSRSARNAPGCRRSTSTWTAPGRARTS